MLTKKRDLPIAITVILLCAAAFTTVMCNNSTVVDTPILATGSDYNNALAEAEKLSKGPLTKRENGDYLTDEDRDLLTKAVPQFRALIGFDPGQFAPRLALGKIFLELDDPVTADEYLLYCLGTLPKEKTPEIRAIEAECRYELANARIKSGNYKDAVTEVTLAIAISKENPNYYVTRAAAYSELRRPEEAMADVKYALKLKPEHRKAQSLLKLFESRESAPGD